MTTQPPAWSPTPLSRAKPLTPSTTDRESTRWLRLLVMLQIGSLVAQLVVAGVVLVWHVRVERFRAEMPKVVGGMNQAVEEHNKAMRQSVKDLDDDLERMRKRKF